MVGYRIKIIEVFLCFYIAKNNFLIMIDRKGRVCIETVLGFEEGISSVIVCLDNVIIDVLLSRLNLSLNIICLLYSLLLTSTDFSTR